MFWWVCFVLWQEGRLPGGRQRWALGLEGGGWNAGGSQCLHWCGHLWAFASSELSSPSSRDCSDEKCFSGNLTFSSLVTRSLGKTINFYQNCYFLEKRSLLFKKGDILFVFIGWSYCSVTSGGEHKECSCFEARVEMLQIKGIWGWAGHTMGVVIFDEWTDFLVSIKSIASQFRSSTLSSTNPQWMSPKRFSILKEKKPSRCSFCLPGFEGREP